MPRPAPLPSAADPLTPDGEAVARFQRDWLALTGSGVSDRALIAVSGGADSVALLLLHHAAVPGRCAAVTVDHGLRIEAVSEAAMVASLCARLGVPHATLSGALPDRAGSTANLSARARELRYDLLGRHAEAAKLRWIVTAHHADDQRETVVMRLNRGSGVRGLSAIRARDDRTVRPLLGWRRQELADICAASGIAPVIDPSNIDERFDRARLRKTLANADWLDPHMVARSASALHDADQAIEWSVDRVASDHCQFAEGYAVLPQSLWLPREIKRRLIERCAAHVDPLGDYRDAGRALDALERWEHTTVGRVNISLVLAKEDGLMVPAWMFRLAPPRRAT